MVMNRHAIVVTTPVSVCHADDQAQPRRPVTGFVSPTRAELT